VGGGQPAGLQVEDALLITSRGTYQSCLQPLPGVASPCFELMNESTLLDLVKVTLEAIGTASLDAHTSWNKGQPPPFNLASILTDRRDLIFQEDALLSLLFGIKGYRESGVTLSQIPANLEEELKSWLVAARIPTVAEPSMGISLSREEDTMSLMVTSPLIRNWENTSSKALYYPLVSVVGHPQGQYLTIVESINEKPFNGTRRFYDDCKILSKSLIRIWGRMLYHWLFVKQEEHPTRLGTLSSVISLIPLI
jgi:hypothetical protein